MQDAAFKIGAWRLQTEEAQFAIVELGPVTAARTFTRVVSGTNLFARLHSIWGLGQIAHRSQLAVNELNKLLEDQDAEVRAQAAKTWLTRKSLKWWCCKPTCPSACRPKKRWPP